MKKRAGNHNPFTCVPVSPPPTPIREYFEGRVKVVVYEARYAEGAEDSTFLWT